MLEKIRRLELENIREKEERERLQRENLKNQGKAKLEKTKEYGTIVKDSFKPKISEEKRNKSLQISQTLNLFDEEISEIIDGKEYKRVAR